MRATLNIFQKIIWNNFYFSLLLPPPPHFRLKVCSTLLFQKFSAAQTCHKTNICNPGVLNYFFLRATKDQRQFKDRCLRAKWSPLSYVFLCILELTKGQTSMVCGPDLAHGPPFEKACCNLSKQLWHIFNLCQYIFVLTSIHGYLFLHIPNSIVLSNHTSNVPKVITLIFLTEAFSPSLFKLAITTI